MKPILLSDPTLSNSFPRMPLGNVLSVDSVRPPEPLKRSSPAVATLLMAAYGMSAPFRVGKYFESDYGKLSRYPEEPEVAQELKRKAQEKRARNNKP